jgi:hypothetical protein
LWVLLKCTARVGLARGRGPTLRAVDRMSRNGQDRLIWSSPAFRDRVEIRRVHEHESGRHDANRHGGSGTRRRVHAPG